MSLSYHDFIAQLTAAGLTVRRFAELIGMQPNSISNNKKRGVVPIHLAVIASLLAEMKSRNVDFDAVFARLSPCPKKPRGASKAGNFGGDPQGVLELEK